MGPPMRQNTTNSDYQSQGRSTPGSGTRQNTAQSNYALQGPPGPPSRQNTGMNEYTARPSRRPGGPGLPNRQMTGRNAYEVEPRAGPSIPLIESQGSRNQAQSSSSDSYGPSTSIPGKQYATQNRPYDMQSRLPPPASNPIRPSTDEANYMPYNPNAAGNMTSLQLTSVSSQPHRDFTSSPTHRNFSAPLRSARQPEYFNQQRQPPQRSVTVPLPNTATYDDSIYDIYGDEEEEQNMRPLPPVRAATASPGSRNWNNQSGYRSNASNNV